MRLKFTIITIGGNTYTKTWAAHNFRDGLDGWLLDLLLSDELERDHIQRIRQLTPRYTDFKELKIIFKDDVVFEVVETTEV